MSQRQEPPVVAVIRQHTDRMRLLARARQFAIYRAINAGVPQTAIAKAAGVSDARISQMKQEAKEITEEQALEAMRKEQDLARK